MSPEARMVLEAALSIVSLLQEPSPRILVSLGKRSPAAVVVTIENLAPRPLVLPARTYLTLHAAEEGEPGPPRFWAEVTKSPLPTPSHPMRLGPRERIEIALDLGALTWAADRSGLAVAQPVARAAPPGAYELQVQVVDDDDHWWRSSGVPARVARGGALKL
jgi:hypothetical protein